MSSLIRASVGCLWELACFWRSLSARTFLPTPPSPPSLALWDLGSPRSPSAVLPFASGGARCGVHALAVAGGLGAGASRCLVALGGDDCAASVLELAAGRAAVAMRVRQGSRVTALAWAGAGGGDAAAGGGGGDAGGDSAAAAAAATPHELLVGCEDGGLALFDVRALREGPGGAHAPLARLSPHRGALRALALRADGALATGGDDGLIALHQLAQARAGGGGEAPAPPLRTLTAHTDFVRALAWATPGVWAPGGGGALLSGGWEGAVMVHTGVL